MAQDPFQNPHNRNNGFYPKSPQSNIHQQPVPPRPPGLSAQPSNYITNNSPIPTTFQNIHMGSTNINNFQSNNNFQPNIKTWTPAPQQQQQIPPQQQNSFQQPFNPSNVGGTKPDFFNQIASNPMAGMAMNQASNFFQNQSQLYIPGALGFWGSLKFYFIVNNSYVLQKLKVLVVPFKHKNWRRIIASNSNSNYNNTNNNNNNSNTQQVTPKIQYAHPANDINAPDLYLPLMGFVTYILIVGYVKGTSGKFSPDVIGEVASYCILMQLLEIGIIKFCLYLLKSSMNFLDLVCFTGYKYISLVINMTFHIMFGKWAYFIILLYTGIATSFFMLNVLKGGITDGSYENKKFKNYMIFGIAVLQMILIWWNAY